MIRVEIGTLTNRVKKTIDENKTIREVLAENDVPDNIGTINLDGRALRSTELDMTFSAMGYSGDGEKNQCKLVNVPKMENAL